MPLNSWKTCELKLFDQILCKMIDFSLIYCIFNIFRSCIRNPWNLGGALENLHKIKNMHTITLKFKKKVWNRLKLKVNKQGQMVPGNSKDKIQKTNSTNNGQIVFWFLPTYEISIYPTVLLILFNPLIL